jgi:urease accessory protein
MVNQHGKGFIECKRVLEKTQITKISHQYPLRLMKPKSHSNDHQAVYILSYGGGLLSGDLIEIQVTVDSECQLSLHSQASTKVYKRTGLLSAAQNMSCFVKENGLLAILPEPVTCFSQSAYKQHQSFYLERFGSLVLLDWMTSGRQSRGESWDFDSFQSENKVYLDGQLIVRDAWLLDSEMGNLEKRMGSYQCIANLILIGPKLTQTIEETIQNHKKQVVYKNNSLKKVPIIWSLSNIMNDGQVIGVMIRAASVDTIQMRQFLTTQLQSIPSDILDYFSRI